jgi:hypothetical protein
MGMTVTYKPMRGFPDIKTPVLHRVVYAKTADDIVSMYQRSYKDHLVNAWLEANCQHPYYHSPGYLREKFIEFECDQDALVFALKFAGYQNQDNYS